MNINKYVFFAAFCLLASSSQSCADGTGRGDTDTTTATDNCEVEGLTTILLEDTQNYEFQSTLTIESTRVMSRSDIHFDWSGLTEDLIGDPIDPILEIGMIQVVLWGLSQTELMERINDDSWNMSNIVAPGVIYTKFSTASADYFDLLSAGGLPIPKGDLIDYLDTDIFAPEKHSYAVMLSSGTTLGKDTRGLALFEVDPKETNQDVFISSESTELAYEVDLTSLEPIEIPSGKGDIQFDWTDSLALNAMGREFVPTAITEAILVHYPDATVPSLETDFLHIEQLAKSRYHTNIPAGTSVELEDMSDESKVPFTGISEEGIYLFGLICGACSNPAPWFLTILKAC